MKRGVRRGGDEEEEEGSEKRGEEEVSIQKGGETDFKE